MGWISIVDWSSFSFGVQLASSVVIRLVRSVLVGTKYGTQIASHTVVDH